MTPQQEQALCHCGPTGQCIGPDTLRSGYTCVLNQKAEAELASLRADLQQKDEAITKLATEITRADRDRDKEMEKRRKAEADLQRVTEERDQDKELVRLWMAAGEESEAALRDLRAKIQHIAERLTSEAFVESHDPERSLKNAQHHQSKADALKACADELATLLASGVGNPKQEETKNEP